MKLLIYIFEVLVSYMRVYLCRADVGVSEHSLYTADIGAVHQQVSGIAMAHGMRRHVLDDASQPGVFANDALNASG